jgi:sugar phosphate isomerase/epimerase
LVDLICSYYTVSGVSPTAGGHSPRPFAERVRACANAGYTGVGIHVRDYRSLREQGHSDRELLAVVRDHGIEHVEVEFLLNWFADGAAGEQSRRDESTLFQMADLFAARVMFLGGDMAEGNPMPFGELTERFLAVAERAAGAGVRLGVEPCAWTNIGTLDDALRIVRAANSSHIGLFLDVWHLHRRGLDYQHLRAIEPDLIFGVQLDDVAARMQGTPAEDCLNNRLLPGRGEARTADFVQVLLEMGVTCPMSVEVISDAQRALPLAEAARVSFDAAEAVIAQAQRKLGPNGGLASGPARTI